MPSTGSIFLHCDKAASHNLRVSLDKVFGSKNFQSEIIWSYKRWSNSKKALYDELLTATSDDKLNKVKTAFEEVNINQ